MSSHLTNDGVSKRDGWANVFDKSLATPVPQNLTLERSNTLKLEDVQEVVSEEIDIYVSHVFKPAMPPSTVHGSKPKGHACACHGRERRTSLDEKPVKPVKGIQPKPVKPVKQDSEKSVVLSSGVSQETARVLEPGKAKQDISLTPPKQAPDSHPQEVSQENKKAQSTDVGPVLSHSTATRPSTRSSSSSQRKIPAKEHAKEPVRTAVPGGEPITLDTARALRILLFGTPFSSFSTDWRKQHINFFKNMSYALSFYKVFTAFRVALMHGKAAYRHVLSGMPGPDGVMACLEGFLLRHLLYGQPSIELVKSMLTPMSSDREKALITAMSQMLWQAGGQTQATVVLPCGECHWITMEDYREDHLTEKLHIFKFHNYDSLARFVKRHLAYFESTSGNGCILLLYSVILSRTISRVVEDLSEPDFTLMGPHDSCSQAMINLLLTGRASQHVFNGDVECTKSGRRLVYPMKGVKFRSEVGFLSIDEHNAPELFLVGSMLKTPRFPVWVVNTGGRYGVLFALNKDLVNDWRLERRFDLLFCTGSSKRNTDECIFTVDTRDFSNHEDFLEDEPSNVEHCIRTKWPGAVIERDDEKS